MRYYRVYLISDEGHITSMKIIEATSDEAAVVIAKQYLDRCDVEVWDADRRVALLSYKN